MINFNPYIEQQHVYQCGSCETWFTPDTENNLVVCQLDEPGNQIVHVTYSGRMKNKKLQRLRGNLGILKDFFANKGCELWLNASSDVDDLTMITDRERVLRRRAYSKYTITKKEKSGKWFNEEASDES